MDVASFRQLSFLCCLLVIPIYQASAIIWQSGSYPWNCYNNIGNYTADSTYETNLKTVLSTLTSNTEINYGFYNLSYGETTEKVYATGLCRGDVNPDDCRTCLYESSVILTTDCPNQKGAIRWHDNCTLRYSNNSLFGIMETSPLIEMFNVNNATDVNQFNQVLDNLLRSLRSTAASGDSRRKYAANSSALVFQNIYGLVQCTPDLSQQDCNDCLDATTTQLSTCCNGKMGARLFTPSCNIRYEMSLFYNPTADAPPPTNNTSPSPEGKSNTALIAIAVVVPVVVVVVLVVLIRRMARKIFEARENDEDDLETNESLQFNFDTIRVATSDFSDSNKLGQGGFGAVYRGRLSNGQEIAVKRLSSDSSQGDIEFKNEVLLVAKLQHRNLVRLLGFCLKGREMLLVYEFIPNKSLDYFIFDPTKRAQLDWESRYKIIRGIARGILYLHEDSRLRIIHRDLKASNILLDEEMNPKISDFGMARLFVVGQTHGDTNRIVGTFGYMAPEYAMHGKFSVKSDVFSFGVLVLEIVSGRKNIPHGENIDDLLSFAWRNWREGTATNIVDQSLNNSSRIEMMIRCIHIGLLCVQENLVDRPTMATVVLMLNSYSLSLPVPSEPAFFMDSRTRSLPGMPSGEYNSRSTRSSKSTSILAQASENEASITELYPR